jgi:hypothetical protein
MLHRYAGGPGTVHPRLASFLRSYQGFADTPGPLLGLALLAGLLAAVGVGRARNSGLRSAAFLLTGVTLAVCLGSVALSHLSLRYQLPQIIFLPATAALGLTALSRRPESVRRLQRKESSAVPSAESLGPPRASTRFRA